jgi:hypothetical protein
MAMDPITMMLLSQAGGAALGGLTNRFGLGKQSVNDAVQNAPQYDEISPMLGQSYQMRGQIQNRVDDRRNQTLSRLLNQMDKTPVLSSNGSRNIAQANAQNDMAFKAISGMESDLGVFEDELTAQADQVQAQGRSKLAEIMQLNKMAREQAARNTRVANQNVSAANMSMGLQLGSQVGQGLVQSSMFKDQLKAEEERYDDLKGMLGKYTDGIAQPEVDTQNSIPVDVRPDFAPEDQEHNTQLLLQMLSQVF